MVYLSAMEETKYAIAQANAAVSDDNELANEFVNARIQGEATIVARGDIDYMDVSPKQVVSVAASMIPFLENDDANRALMGSNMQRQAVPLIESEAPLVGTGMEAIVARDSRAAVVAGRAGVVEQVDATRIVFARPRSWTARGQASISTVSRNIAAPTRTAASTSARS